jgi:hypothetical protein
MQKFHNDFIQKKGQKFMQKINSILIIALMVFVAIGCNDEGTITTIPVEEGKTENPHNAMDVRKAIEKTHIVKVKEVLPTSKYVYLYVNEGEEEFWVATIKQEVNVGDSYMYKGGILKKNFESKEYNRVFDVVYLVTNLVPITKTANSESFQKKEDNSQLNSPVKESELIEHEGSVKIVDLVANPQKYKGQNIQLTGRVSKINPNIMKRNWIHLKDGSKDDYDLVITSNTFVPEGSIITVEGVVTLDIDFGAGYKYDILVENAELAE